MIHEEIEMICEKFIWFRSIYYWEVCCDRSNFSFCSR